MSKRLTWENTYPFYWLDELAEITLNPQKNNVERLKAAELTDILERLPDEFANIKIRLKTQAFCIYSNDHLSLIAGQYDQCIRLLEQQARSNIRLYPKDGLLRDAGQLLINCLEELAFIVRQRYDRFLYAGASTPESSVSALKIRCRLSTDQLGLILRAADDVKLLLSRSLSLIFKSIVPYLSTEKKEHLSWDAMRSSTYHPDESDKTNAINALQQMIDKIKSYH